MAVKSRRSSAVASIVSQPGYHMTWRLDLLAAAAGALLVLAFAPFNIWPVAIVAPAAFFYVLIDASPGLALRRGFLFGFGLFAAGVSWIYFCLHLFGDAVAPLAAALTLLFVVIMASFPALLAWIWSRCSFGDLRASPLGLLLLAPALWTLLEWVRGWFLSGFPWLLLGHSQTDTWLAAYVPLLGVYGVSWLLALQAGCLAYCLHRVLNGAWRQLWPLGVLAVIWLLALPLGQMAWTQPQGEPISANLVQGNVQQQQKYLPETLLPTLERYSQLSRQYPNVDLVIWPETAVPTFIHRVEPLLQPLASELQAGGSQLLLGIFEYDAEAQRYYNSLYQFPAAGAAPQSYRKRHLVPFGEFMPLRGLLQVLAAFIAIPMSDLSPGADQQPPLLIAGHAAAVSICYEDAFGEELIEQARQAGFLINISNDSWYGDSLAPHQHLQIARMRSLESGRPMLRATSTGISAAIDADGQLLARAPQFADFALHTSIQPRSGLTPYLRFGNWPVLLSLFLVLGGAYTSAFLRKPRNL